MHTVPVPLDRNLPVSWDLAFTVGAEFSAVSAHLRSPALVLSPENVMMLNEILKSRNFNDTKAGVSNLMRYSGTGNYPTDGDSFWASSTALIESISRLIRSEVDFTMKINLEASNAQKNALIGILIQMVVTTILVIILGTVFTRLVTGPIKLIGSTLSSIANGRGDLTIESKVSGNDEIGKLSGAFNSFTANLSMMLKDIKTAAESLMTTGDDLARNMQQTASAENEISTIMASMGRQIETQYKETDSSVTLLETFFKKLEDLHSVIESQAASVIESNASIEEMIANIRSEKTSVENMSEVFELMVAEG